MGKPIKQLWVQLHWRDKIVIVVNHKKKVMDNKSIREIKIYSWIWIQASQETLQEDKSVSLWRTQYLILLGRWLLLLISLEVQRIKHLLVSIKKKMILMLQIKQLIDHLIINKVLIIQDQLHIQE